MKNALLTSCLLALFAIFGCSSPTPPQSEDLRGLLPANFLGFVTAELQSEQVRSFIGSPPYKTYMAGLESSLDKNKALTGDFTVYWNVLRALGLVPAQNDKNLPFGSIIFFAVAGQQRPVDLGAYYNTTPDVDARTLVTNAQAILKQANITAEPLKAQAYQGIAIRPFGRDASIPQVQQIYRDQLKLDTFYVAANQSRLVLATSLELLERGFGTPKNEAKELIESAEYRRVIASASDGRESMSAGVLDIAKILRSFAPQFEQANQNPLSIVGFAVDLNNDLISMNAAAIYSAKSPETERIKHVLYNPAAVNLLANLPLSSAIGFSVDATLLDRAIDEYANELPPDAQPIRDLVKRIRMISFGVQSAEFASMYPDFVFAATAADPKALIDSIKQLSAQVLPVGIAWRSTRFGEYDGELLATPLGIGVKLVANSDTVLLTSGEKVIADVLGKDASKRLGGAALLAAAAKDVHGNQVGMFINYPNFAALMQSVMQTAAAFAKTDALLQQQNFEQMKYMGKLVMTLGFEDDLLRFGFAQQLDQSAS